METTVDFVLRYIDGRYVPKNKKCTIEDRYNHLNALSFDTRSLALERTKFFTTTKVVKRVCTLESIE